MKIFIIICGIGSLLVGCAFKEKPYQRDLITIVDIGTNDRLELGKQLRVLNSNSPRIVAMDFFLVPDSLDKDSILVKELVKATNTIQVVALHDYDSTTNTWDSLEVSHSKFKVSTHGFSNITTTDDSVFVRQLPLWQSYRNTLVPSFSYAIAQKYSNVKSEYRKTGTDDVQFPLLRFSSGYKVIRIEDLMSGNFDKSDIQDKIVIMGFIGYGDDFYLGHDRRWKVNGVAIHAAIVNEIMGR